uniref:FLYWCH-type domain-containing protein n=1 Tax=Ditylenchus dipsaci TaxID=166011 RepID=A0A915E8Y1_9BILA
MYQAIEEADQGFQREEFEQTDGEAEGGSDSGEKAGQVAYMHKNNKNGSKTFWECIHRYDGCKKRLHTLAGTMDVVKEIGEHKHGVDPKAIPSRTVLRKGQLRPWRIRRRYLTRNSSEIRNLCKGWWPRVRRKRWCSERKRE